MKPGSRLCSAERRPGGRGLSLPKAQRGTCRGASLSQPLCWGTLRRPPRGTGTPGTLSAGLGGGVCKNGSGETPFMGRSVLGGRWEQAVAALPGALCSADDVSQGRR